MAWTSINPSQTDADSPLNQVLFDAIREDLDDLNTRASQGSPDYVYHPLGGSAPGTQYADASGYNASNVFYLPTPPTGKSWSVTCGVRQSACSVVFSFLDKDNGLVSQQTTAYSSGTDSKMVSFSFTGAVWGYFRAARASGSGWWRNAAVWFTLQ